MHSDNSNRKLSIKSLMLLSLILIVSVSMFSSPTLSSLMYSILKSFFTIKITTGICSKWGDGDSR